MAQKVTAMDIRMATAMVGQIPNVAAFCREHEISREAFYKWRKRFREHGIDGMVERSRRPHTMPGQTPAAVEDVVLRTRKVLKDDGADYGPQSVCWALQRGTELANEHVPSPTTIWRILVRHGVIDPQPHKRPKSSRHRFVYPRPNDCWQSDWTHWQLADGTKVAIAGTLDDHSRYVPALQAGPGRGTAELVWAVMCDAITECGIPAMSLTDNGFVYTGRLHNFVAAFEKNLHALGTRTINSTPSHPQTCGKIERFWQTLKKWLNAHDAPCTVEELNALLKQFRRFYNHYRPHRALHGATPAETFAATVKARPADRPLPTPVLVNRIAVGSTGSVGVGRCKVHVGNRWLGHIVHTIRDGDHVVIFSGNRLVRELTLDTTRRYQPSASARNQPRGDREPPHSGHTKCQRCPGT